MRVYAIGDVHGHLDKLKDIHGRIAADRAQVNDPNALVVHVGDLVDRGPDSAGVISYLLEGMNAGKPWEALRGNHDRLMSRFLDPARLRDQLRTDLHWLQFSIGGSETLQSYGVDTNPERGKEAIHADALAAVPQEHIAFLTAMPNVLAMEGLYFVHAGIRPGVPLDEQVEDDLVWIREPFLSDPRDHGPLIVHGHSPVRSPVHYGNRLNIDSAAAYGGPLSGVVIEDGQVFLLGEEGREELRPTAEAYTTS